MMRTIDQIRKALTSRPRSSRCDAKCKGWAVFELDRAPGIEIEACDECDAITDDEARTLPEARRALADALLTDNGRTRRPRVAGRQLYHARARVLREYDLRFALSLVVMWCEADSAADRVWNIARITREALDR